MLPCHEYSCTDMIYDRAKITNYISNPAVLQIRQKLTIRFRFWIYHLLTLIGVLPVLPSRGFRFRGKFLPYKFGVSGTTPHSPGTWVVAHHIPFCFRSATQSELSDSRISKAKS